MSDHELCASAMPADFVYDRATESWRIARSCPGAASNRYGLWRRADNLEDGAFLTRDGAVAGAGVEPWSGSYHEASAHPFNIGPDDPMERLDPWVPFRVLVRAYHDPDTCRCWGVWCSLPNGKPSWAAEPLQGGGVDGQWAKIARGSYPAMRDRAFHGAWSRHAMSWAVARQFQTLEERAPRSTSYPQIMGRLQRRGSPPPVVVTYCADCKADPCDCMARVWTYAFRRPGVKTHLNFIWQHDGRMTSTFVGYTRAEVIAKLEKRDLPGYEYGPLQRLTEPVHIFGSELPTDTCHIDGCRVHATCKLSWCGRPAAYDTHCSDRCREYDARRLEVDRRARHFLVRVHARVAEMDAQRLPPLDFASEIDWATSKLEDELAAIERQFRSLRPEA